MRQPPKVAEADADDGQERANRLAKAVEEHRRTLADAEAPLDALRQRLQEAEERAAEARRVLSHAEREAERARAKRAAAEKALKARP
jgi:septal ring factor EnvC (AmiA/AmiB activator)